MILAVILREDGLINIKIQFCPNKQVELASQAFYIHPHAVCERSNQQVCQDHSYQCQYLQK